MENPYTEAALAIVHEPSEEQLEAALRGASESAGSWAATPAGERAELLHGIAAGLRGRTAELAELMTLEGGKPRVENADEVGWTAAAFDFYAELARAEAGRVIPPIESTQLALVLKEPIGVVAAIVPWNYPLLLLAWKLAPALAAGNAVVAKPSELTPLSTLALAPLFGDLPAGVVTLLAGGGEVGASIVDDARIGCVAFTGSTATGTAIARACAGRMARVNLEMGGKDPFLVLPDVVDEITVAARGGAWAAFLNAGQVCTSAERFYVAAPVYDSFVAEMVEYTESLRLGDPLAPTTDLGPMVSAAQREKVVTQIAAAVDAGAELLTGGGRGGQERGHFLAPAVITGAAGQHRAAARGDVRPGRPDRAGARSRRGDPPGQRLSLRARRQRLHP